MYLESTWSALPTRPFRFVDFAVQDAASGVVVAQLPIDPDIPIRIIAWPVIETLVEPDERSGRYMHRERSTVISIEIRLPHPANALRGNIGALEG